MSRDGLPTGGVTSATNDVADPHPAQEEDSDQIPHPGGAKSKNDDLEVNSYTNDGKAPPRPHNRGSGPA